MPIVVLALVLAAYAYALIAVPEFRRWGIVGGVVAAVGLAVYFWLTTPETVQTGQRIAPEEVVLDRIEVTPTVRGAVMTGRVLNRSATWRLREVTLGVRLRDCPDEATPTAECPIIGEATAIARPDVPPGQIRALSAHFLFTNLPAPAGVLDWDWTVLETRATQ